jgi:hypothetical protein
MGNASFQRCRDVWQLGSLTALTVSSAPCLGYTRIAYSDHVSASAFPTNSLPMPVRKSNPPCMDLGGGDPMMPMDGKSEDVRYQIMVSRGSWKEMVHVHELSD